MMCKNWVAVLKGCRHRTMWQFRICVAQHWPKYVHNFKEAVADKSIRRTHHCVRRILGTGEALVKLQLDGSVVLLQRNFQTLSFLIIRSMHILLARTRRMVFDTHYDFCLSYPRELCQEADSSSPFTGNFAFKPNIHCRFLLQKNRNSDSLKEDSIASVSVVTEKTEDGKTAQDEELVPLPRLESLARILKCNVEEMKGLVAKHPFFIHLGPELIKEKLFIMLSFGLTHEFVREHARLLYQTSAYELHRRLQLLQEHSFLEDASLLNRKVLAYYLECDIPYFDYSLKNLIAQRDALEGCSDQQAYLQFRLQCSESEAKALLTSYPLSRKVSNVRLKGLLDFFLEEAGMTSQFVMAHKRILVFSISRYRRRLEVMRAAGITSEDLMVHIWFLSEKKFKNAYESYL